MDLFAGMNSATGDPEEIDKIKKRIDKLEK
jgi:tetrahydromethanopterin S-methyltransferase subunit G